ncbi:MAG TPA: hypothetical protein VES39_00255 [Rhodospirillales bacterium]|nr:hypothetical protein [Rhodospirillales bacterium]
MMPNLGPYDQFLFALVAMLGTTIAMLLLLWATQFSPYSAWIRSFRGVAQNFMSVISVLFALNIAFLAHDTWTAHDRALDTVFLEAGSLRTILDLAERLPDDVRRDLRAAVGDYARLAVDDEWPKLARRGSSEAAAARLDELVTLVAAASAAAAGPTVQAALLQQTVAVRHTRDLRVALSQTHVNPLKWLGMAFLGLLTMISIAMVHIDQPRAEILAVLLFAAAAAPTAAIILVHGNPFQEPAAVTAAPIAAVLQMATSGGH